MKITIVATAYFNTTFMLFLATGKLYILYYHKEHLTITKFTNSRPPGGMPYTKKKKYSTVWVVVSGIYQNNVGLTVFTRICHGSKQTTDVCVGKQ